MSKRQFISRTATTFTRSGALDEDAFRKYVSRFVDAGVAVFLASTGSGEGGALTPSEVDRVYRIGVEVCRGKVMVNSNQPEKPTFELSLEESRIAMAAGVDALNLYGPDGYHGYAATEVEYIRYFDRLLAAIDYPVTLCPNPTIGYAPQAETIAEIANKHKQVIGILLSGRPYDDSYYLHLRDNVRSGVKIFTNSPGSLNTLALGAAGVEEPYGNLIPKTCSGYLSAFDNGDLKKASELYDSIRKFAGVVNRWSPQPPRWIKAGMQIFKLPGWEGGLREPYMAFSDHQLKEFKKELLALNIDELNDMHGAAG